MIRLVKRPVEGALIDATEEYYILVPGETGPDGTVADWEAHKVSHRQLRRLHDRIGDEIGLEESD